MTFSKYLGYKVTKRIMSQANRFYRSPLVSSDMLEYGYIRTKSSNREQKSDYREEIAEGSQQVEAFSDCPHACSFTCGQPLFWALVWTRHGKGRDATFNGAD